MTARETIAAALHDGANWDVLMEEVRTSWLQDADMVIDAIRGMSHDELRQLRPDIATLYDATRDTANTRGDYIINLTDGRLRAIEQLHTRVGGYDLCTHCGRDWPCPTTRALRGNP